MSDQTARDTALETTRSFIVQAPAGSGKTELLIQRYLALLANVETPEQIVAITFTRKAAAEMRARALRALRAAEEELPVDEPHQQRTRDLALGVLSRGQQLDWHLIAQPQRLRIDTLDALNAWLAQQLPVLAGGVSGATVVERADELYAVATRRVLEELGTSDEIGGRLQALLERLDNRVGRLESLLAELLPRREQWLPYLVSGSDEELRTGLEHALDCLVSEELERVAAKIPPASIPKVIAVLRHAAGFATDESFATVPSDWPESLDSLPTSTAQLDSWQALADLLLIKSCKWRTQLPAKLGFGVDHPDERNRLIDLIAALQPENGLLEELHGLRSLPNARYEETQWQVLADLRVVLLRLAGMLRVVFAERNCVDFAEVAAAAEQALGAIDQPSELLLALDYRIQHILVDEFQDTSHSQSRLLELLTAGWQPGDGRTLFLVGDPMQSIYRFRNADMSLFLKVKAHGVGDIRCESLTLSRNFRSRPAVIDWVNRIFPSIFPDEDDMSAGAARFYPCESVKDSAENSQVRFHALTSDNPQVEVEKVIELLTEERESHPRDSVAILVKSRSHLAGLHDQLRARRIDAHAVELEPPSEREAVQDLLGLTRALLHPADRIAWLAVLRAPWCGLTWADLNALVEQDPNRSVWDLMNSPERTASLSEDGRVRLENCRHALQGAAECRAQQPLSRWVERTWVTLGGPACLNSAEELDQADRFFATLGQLDHRGDVDDPASLETFYSDPRGQGEVPAAAGVEIMTIHRAKGLEFDSVILLGLGRAPRPEQAKGLYWLERTTTSGREDLLLVPLSAASSEKDPLAGYLKAVEKRHDTAERARLLYVATTRARSRLNLVAQIATNKDKPESRSLLNLLWPTVTDQYDGIETKSQVPPEAEFIEPKLRRLITTFDLTESSPEQPESPQYDAAAPRPEFEWAGQAALQIGTVVHDALQRMAETGIDAWDEDRIRSEAERFSAQLRLLGVEEGEIASATARVTEALSLVLGDTTGRWLLQDHEEAASELPLTVRSAAGLEHLRLDRTFVDKDGTRWIIDFKTSSHEGGSIENFLDSEVERYSSQLARYASAMAAIEDRPIKVGLYFPLQQAFRDWTPELH